jgi:hypothetical protein
MFTTYNKNTARQREEWHQQPGVEVWNMERVSGKGNQTGIVHRMVGRSKTASQSKEP